MTMTICAHCKQAAFENLYGAVCPKCGRGINEMIVTFSGSGRVAEMTEVDLIARQAKQLEELRDEVADLKERIKRAKLHIYCVGGPLNDNVLGYSKPQMVTFFKIAEELDCF